MVLRPSVKELAVGLILFCRGVYPQSQVTWMNPSLGSTYTASSMLNVSWTVSKEVVSPSFKLCAKPATSTSLSSGRRSTQAKRWPKNRDTYKDSGDDQSPVSWLGDQPDEPTPSSGLNSTTSSSNCGASVWPTVREDNAEDQYSASLSIPELSASGIFYLLMQSDFGDLYRSPTFQVLSNLDAGLAQSGPALASTNAITSTLDDASTASVLQTLSTLSTSAPLEGSTGILPSRLTGKITGTPILQPIGPLSPSFSVSGAAISGPPSSVVSPTSPQMVVDATSRQSKAVAAAVGIPLSIMAAAASLGAVVCVWSRKKKERRFHGQEEKLANIPSSYTSDSIQKLTETGPVSSSEMEKGSAASITSQRSQQLDHLELPQLPAVQTVPASVSSHGTTWEQLSRAGGGNHATIRPPIYAQPVMTSSYMPVQSYPYHQQPTFIPHQGTLFSPGVDPASVLVPQHIAVPQQYYDPGVYTNPVPRPSLTHLNLKSKLPQHVGQPYATISRESSLSSSSSLPYVLRPGIRSWTSHGSDGSLDLPTPPIIENDASRSSNQATLNSYMDVPTESPRGASTETKPLPRVPVNYATRPARR
ncbi:uncharacterized protein EI90DRAFT_510264 [Cantharellus anzutake]|uniref:uncharacterized protein n=1 Tax=Cantharellus anzutake TaxID=1750568 RepID=UPI0019085462|nr:uncharacterized protein EI90DRAFT_510264 [Cantharellus anzutake]KAF8334128.1 hypothetical protein EI90DRAFT_510264 [Cantharellus anzutake]